MASPIKNLFFGYGKKQFELKHYKRALLGLLPRVEERVIISRFSLSNEDLQDIFEHMTSASSLELQLCDLSGITNKLSLPKYSPKLHDIFFSLDSKKVKDEELRNFLKYFIQAAMESGFSETLAEVKVNKKVHPKAVDFFSKLGINLIIDESGQMSEIIIF